jgi:predicted XRE-type DNA-binding protein
LASTEAEEFNKIQLIAARDEVSLIVIDTMERILPQTKGKRDYHYYVRCLDNWANLALQTNTCILMVHHTRKGDGSAEHNPQNAILGSVGIAATFDTNLIMERDKNGGYLLHVAGKDIQQNTFRLSKNNVEFSWETKSPTEDLGSAQRQVLQFIKQNKDCTQADIVKGLGKQKSQISNVVTKLCSEGYIYKEGGLLFINTPS